MEDLIEDKELDRELKEKQLENEKRKGGCLTMLTGSFISLVLLFTAGPIFAGIVFLVWIVIAIVEEMKK